MVSTHPGLGHLRLGRTALALVLAVVAWGLLAPGAPARAAKGTSCQAVHVPVTVTGAPGETVYGELCRPAGKPRAVQLLVPGATYNHHYWDVPFQPARYSYVRKALEAGYATFNVDRFGSGLSTRPPSEQVTIRSSTEALHQVVEGLRSGAVGGRPFRRVVWIGHSYGALYGWLEASMFGGAVDAFVLTAVRHFVKPSGLEQALAANYPAAFDPKFAGAGLDEGYLTTMPGTRGDVFYHAPTADPRVIAVDERLKDIASATDLGGGLPLLDSPPPTGAPSRAIDVPTLLVAGAEDSLSCGEPDGLDCTEASVRAHEEPYYSAEARLEVMVARDTGHSLQLHRSAPRTSNKILDWLARARLAPPKK